MSLSLGTPTGTGRWGYPSALYNYQTNKFDTGGMVWHGRNPPNEKAMLQLQNFPNWVNMELDALTLVGKKDPEWTTWRKVNKSNPPYVQHIVVVG